MAPKVIFEREKAKIPPVSRAIIKKVLKGCKAIMTSDAASDSRFRESMSIVKRKVKAVICAPLVAREHVMGVIYIGASGATNLFVTEDMELIGSLARLSAVTLDNLRARKRQRRLLMNMMRSLVTAMELTLPKIHGHSMRVANLARSIANERFSSAQKVHLCQMGGYLHDIGKIVTGTKKFEDEKQIEKNYREHVNTGRKILAGTDGIDDLIPAIRYHHERHDGSGFPKGLKGEEIPEIARIVALANYLDHQLQEKRITEIIEHMNDLSGKKFHPEDIKALQQAYQKGRLQKTE